jgi:hypothetical protein
MYGGRRIAPGDTIYLFADDGHAEPGLLARGIVSAASAVARAPGKGRQTPRVDVEVKRQATAQRRLGRSALREFSDWKDGRPQTELNFKFFRQATHKIGGISDAAARYLDRFLRRRSRASRDRPRATARGRARAR